MSRWGSGRIGTGTGGGGGGASTFLALTDTPGVYVPGQLLAVNGAGTAVEFVGPSSAVGAGPLDDFTRTNRQGALLPFGAIVAQPLVTPLSLVRCDPASEALGVSRPVGIVSAAAGIADLATGAVRTIQGLYVPVLLRPGLTLALGEEVIQSTVTGEGTLPGSGVNEPVAVGAAVQRVGVLIDALTYDGVADLLALIQIDFTQRRRI